MNNIAEALNFSNKKTNPQSIFVRKRVGHINYYIDRLQLALEDIGVSLEDIDDDDIIAAVEVMEAFGIKEDDHDSYYFWIDPIEEKQK